MARKAKLRRDCWPVGVARAGSPAQIDRDVFIGGSDLPPRKAAVTAIFLHFRAADEGLAPPIQRGKRQNLLLLGVRIQTKLVAVQHVLTLLHWLVFPLSRESIMNETAMMSASHAVHAFRFPAVFVTPYRRRTLTPVVLDALAEILADWRCTRIGFGGEADPVPLLVGIRPTLHLPL